ncbi:MAG: crotonyl-CoA carboxylase/reductase, partial [Actinophytocola sp.]
MQKILDAILAGDHAEVGALPVPESYRGVTVRADETDMFAGRKHEDKDQRESLHVDEVP